MKARIIRTGAIMVLVVVTSGSVTALAAGGASSATPETAATAPYVLGQELEPKAPGDSRTPGVVAQPASDYPDGHWDLLLPKDWDPMKDLGGLDLSQLSDNDPRATAALKNLQDAWKDAPVNDALNMSRMRIAGFVVPLDGDRNLMKEFLLVPYFGACIHVPPPPSNQVIHVIAPQGVKGFNTMDAVYVSGTLEVERTDTAMGSSGYRMSGDMVEPYAAPSPQK